MKNLKPLLVATALSFGALSVGSPAVFAETTSAAVSISVERAQQVKYNTVQVDDVEVFYREAGAKDAPVVLLLHGFPTSSHMYRNLIPQLSGDFRVIAPDYPGFGSTKAPARGDYEYTFDNLAKTIEGFTEALDLDEYAIFVFDYGAPVGFRLATANPEKITAIVSQNGNAYDEGITDAWNPIRALWASGEQKDRDALRGLLTIETTTFQYTHGVPEDRLNLVSPDAIAHTQAILDREPELQLDLLGDYKTNIALYPTWQKYLRKNQPPVLAVWGDSDPFFDKAAAAAFKSDVPKAEVHLLSSGHFAIETHSEEIGTLTREFLLKNIK